MKDTPGSRASPRLQNDAVSKTEVTPMVPVPNMKGSDLAYRIDGLIPPKTIELCGTPDKFFVSGILKLLFNKSFRDVGQNAPFGACEQ